MGEVELEVVRAQYRTVNERDWEPSIALFAEDVVLDARIWGILGGVRGLSFYSQRSALQGDRAILEAILGRE